MAGVVAPGELLGALSALLDRLGQAEFPLETEGVDETRELHASIVDQLSDYVVPRLVQLDAPLLVVVGGSTGAGKSTLVNSIIGEVVTEPGVLRPTTRSPVLAHHPDDAAWFQPDRILPDLERTDVPGNSTYGLRLRPSSKVPRGLAILDAPDVDSIDVGNRILATQLLAAADLWLFVTSAARYADQVPWDYLTRAAERSTSVAVVLDRTAADGIAEVRGHLARMMTSRGLSDSPLFTVPETSVDAEGLLPRSAVQPIVGWLHDLAASDETREMIVRSTLDGAVRHNVLRSHDLADAYDEQVAAAVALRERVDQAFTAARATVERAITDGSILSGDVAVRWQHFVGSGEVSRGVEASKVGRIRERVVGGVTGKRSKADDVASALEHELAVLVVDQVTAAITAITADWNRSAAGAHLVAHRSGLDRVSRDLGTRAERVARDWLAGITESVRVAVADRRLSTDVLAFGVPGLAVAVAVAALGDHDSATGRISRKVLDAAVSSDTVDRLVAGAAADLSAGLTRVLADEHARFAANSPDPERVRGIQTAVRDMARRAENARHLEGLESRLGGTHSSRSTSENPQRDTTDRTNPVGGSA